MATTRVPTLDRKLFTPIGSLSQDMVEDGISLHLHAFAPVGHPLVLFSLVDGMPLAALTLRCQDDKVGTLFTVRPASSTAACDFQGMITQDDQEFVLYITNLTNGHINFNVLKKAHHVSEVDVGGEIGLNEINELRPFESYGISADQSTNRALILSSIKTMVKRQRRFDGGAPDDGEEETVVLMKTVGEAEQEAADQSKTAEGTYYFLSVVPDISDTKLCQRFESTRWATVDWFYVCTTSGPPPPQSRVRWGRGSRGGRGGTGARARSRSSRDRDRDVDYHHDGYGYGDEMMMQHGAAAAEDATLLERALSQPRSRFSYDAKKYKCKKRAAGATTNLEKKRMTTNGTNSLSTRRSRSRSRSGSPNKREMMLQDDEQDDDDDDDDDRIDDLSLSHEEKALSTAAAPVSEQLAAAGATALGANVVQDSKAAQVRAGRVVQVHSVVTNVEYNYERASAPCTIGLSVALGLEISVLDPHTFTPAAMEAMQLHIAETFSPLLKRLTETYKEVDCVICLDAHPDCIFYTCGHQCVHFACLTDVKAECPLCRRHIVAKLRVKA